MIPAGPAIESKLAAFLDRAREAGLLVLPAPAAVDPAGELPASIPASAAPERPQDESRDLETLDRVRGALEAFHESDIRSMPIEELDGLARRILEGARGAYPEAVRALDFADAHTIRDMRGYLAARLGSELVSSVGAADVGYAIARGGPEDVARLIAAQGWTHVRNVPNPAGFHDVDLMEDRRGRKTFLITRVNGRDRLAHVASLLRLAGVPERQVRVLGEDRRWTELYRRAFARLGYVPDQVVYGFANTVGAYVFNHDRKVNEAKGFLAPYLAAYARKKAKGGPSVHELSGLDMHVLTFADGRRVWVLHNEYGDRAADLFEALAEHGVRDITFLGTAGGLTSRHAVGDIVSPTRIIGADGKPRGSRFLPGDPGFPAAAYVRVETPNLETREWVRQRQAEGSEVVDVELGRVVERLEGLGANVRLRVFLVVSDVLDGPQASDFTRWDDQASRAFMARIAPRFDAILGRSGRAGYELVAYEAVAFAPDGQDPGGPENGADP